MRALVCQTQSIVPVAAFGPALADAGIELVAWRTDSGAPPPSLDDFGAVIALGGTTNPDEDDRQPWLAAERALLRDALRRDLPVVGLCLGAQLLAQVAGGVASRLARPEIGWQAVPGEPGAADDPVYGSLPERLQVFEWHAFGFSLPPGAALLAGTPDAVQACRVGARAWALQFHLEVDAATVGGWIEQYGDELRHNAIEPSALAAATAERIADNQRNAGAFARAFAAVALGQAGSNSSAVTIGRDSGAG